MTDTVVSHVVERALAALALHVDAELARARARRAGAVKLEASADGLEQAMGVDADALRAHARAEADAADATIAECERVTAALVRGRDGARRVLVAMLAADDGGAA